MSAALSILVALIRVALLLVLGTTSMRPHLLDLPGYKKTTFGLSPTARKAMTIICFVMAFIAIFALGNGLPIIDGGNIELCSFICIQNTRHIVLIPMWLLVVEIVLVGLLCPLLVILIRYAQRGKEKL